MPPQNQTNIPTAQLAQSTHPSPQNSDQLNNKVRNAGQSVFLLGCLMTFIALMSLLGVKSLAEDKQMMSYIFLVIVTLVSIYWVALGRKIKQNATNLPVVFSSIKITIISALAVFVLTLIGMVVKPGGGGGAGLLALILALYLLVAKTGIKKASGL